MNLNQFEVLVHIEAQQAAKLTQRQIAEATNLSAGSVNRIIMELEEKAYIHSEGSRQYILTDVGYAALEPYRVKKAIFFAAGFGSRLVPITLNTPKPLIVVQGRRLIDTMLDAVLAVGIEDITVVRGYLKDNFDILLKKYPMIKFVDNDFYNQANNISSAVLVRDQFDKALVFESDLLLYDPTIIRKYEYRSHYKGIMKSVTDDWYFQTSRDIITGLGIGGRDVYQMIGISYWDSKDAKLIKDDLKIVYEMPGGKEKYWDEVALGVCGDRYKIHVHPVLDGTIIEIDTFAELCNVDPVYNV